MENPINDIGPPGSSLQDPELDFIITHQRITDILRSSFNNSMRQSLCIYEQLNALFSMLL